MVRLTITLNGAERAVAIDPDELPMGFFEDVEEAQDSKKIAPIMRAYGTMLGFTHDEVRSMTRKQFNDIARAVFAAAQEATAVPNESAPASA